MTMEGDEVSVAEQLQDLVLDSDDVGNFLRGLSEYSAALAGDGGVQTDCAVTLYRRNRALTGAGSSERAKILNDIEERIGEGPCLTALDSGVTVLVREVAEDERWPEYTGALLAEGIHSVLAVPLVLEEGAAASVNFFAPQTDAFGEEIVSSAEQYAAQAEKSLRLAVRIGSRQQLAGDLQEAMKSRTAIDLAVGVIMGQQRCSQMVAFGILQRAASARNRKLRDVAQDLLKNITEEGVQTHFDA